MLTQTRVDVVDEFWAVHTYVKFKIEVVGPRVKIVTAYHSSLSINECHLGVH